MHGSQGPLNASDGSITAAWRSRFWPGSAGPELFGVCVMSPLPRHRHRAFLSLGSACAWLRGGLLACSLFSRASAGVFPRSARPRLQVRSPLFSPRESHLFLLAGSFSDSVFDLGVEKFYQHVPRGVCCPSVLPGTRGGLSLYTGRLFFREMFFFVV